MWLNKKPTPKIIIPIYFYIILCMMKINIKKVRETLQHARLKFQWNSWRNNRSNCACQFNDIFYKSVFSLTPDGYTYIFLLLLFWVLFPNGLNNGGYSPPNFLPFFLLKGEFIISRVKIFGNCFHFERKYNPFCIVK